MAPPRSRESGLGVRDWVRTFWTSRFLRIAILDCLENCACRRGARISPCGRPTPASAHIPLWTPNTRVCSRSCYVARQQRISRPVELELSVRKLSRRRTRTQPKGGCACVRIPALGLLVQMCVQRPAACLTRRTSVGRLPAAQKRTVRQRHGCALPKTTAWSRSKKAL